MAEIVVTKENFETEVLSSELPVLVDFWADWCGPCRMVAPILEEMARDLEGKIKVGKVNVDEQGELAAMFGVSSIPTMIVFKDGKAVKGAVGARPRAQIEALLE
ncbi:MAG: thioredoxin [Oscillospiraceae bacterium]|nr:thioredoxin [bacterium]MDY5101196.1 thioredoxin [Oscillospiraceae bacterium]